MESSCFLQALKGENKGKKPIWLMRQAGRYLPEYREKRKKHSLREMFFNPSLAAEVTLMPIKRFGFDAAVVFSDIMVIALSLGFTLDFAEGPVLSPLLHSAQDVENLPLLPVEEVLGFVGETLCLCGRDVPLLGFCGGPFTVASYLIEEKGKVDLKKTKKWLHDDLPSFLSLLDKITTQSVAYLQMQVRKGAQAVQIFDSWAHVLSDEEFATVCLPFWKRLIESVPVPVIVFGRGNGRRIELISSVEPAAISVDGSIAMHQARKKTQAALQGNLEPSLLFRSCEEIREKTEGLLQSMAQDPGFIVNLSHGILPQTPLESVACLVETVRAHGT